MEDEHAGVPAAPLGPPLLGAPISKPLVRIEGVPGSHEPHNLLQGAGGDVTLAAAGKTRARECTVKLAASMITNEAKK